jgi:hypothetical protein
MSESKHRVHVTSQGTPAEQLTQRGTYQATITVGGAFVEFEGDYALSEYTLIEATIESRLRSFVGVSISTEPKPKEQPS